MLEIGDLKAKVRALEKQSKLEVIQLFVREVYDYYIN